MDHSTIKLNDERLKFVTTLPAADFDYTYEFPTEPDLDKLKVWLMLDHLGTRIRDMSGFANNAIIAGHPTLRRASLNLGFQQTSASFGTPVMSFNSGTDVVSQTNGEYIWIPDNPSIQFTNPLHAAGFTICLRFNCLNFSGHTPIGGGNTVRRIAAKSDTNLTGHDITTSSNGWNLVCSNNGVNNGLVFQVIHDGIEYQKRAAGFNTDTWYQVVITYDPNVTANDRIKMYVGGVLTGSNNAATLFLPTTFNLRIGARDSSSGFFQGYIHDFRLYMDKVLTQTEITNLNDNEMTIDNIPKGHAFIVQYALISTVLKRKIHVFDMDGKIKRSRVHSYNMLEKITRSKTHKFSLLFRVPTKSKTHKYHVTIQVLKQKTHRFNMAGKLTLSKTHKYNILNKVTKTKTHKFSLGGLQVQYQRFQKSTTAGSNIVQEVTFTSTPQAIIVWSDNSNLDNSYVSIFYEYYGFSDGTHHACVSGMADDNAATTDTFSGHKDDKVISLMDNDTGVVSAEATVSFSANKAIFNWTTNDNRASYIHCMALWGLNNVEVKTFTTGTSSTGLRTYALNNTSLTPTFLHTITRSGALDWTTGTAQSISIGAAVSTAKQFSISNVSEDGASSSDVKTAYSTTHCLVHYDDDDGSLEMTGSLNSFGAGTFTIDWIDAPSSSSRSFSVLALDAPKVDVGIFTQPNNVTGNQVVNTASTVDAVKGVMVFSNGETSTAVADASRISIGGGTGTGASNQGVIACSEIDGASDSITVKIQKSGAIAKIVTAHDTAASSTTQAEASLNALGTDQFTVNWSVIDSTLRKFHYIAFGS
jgi:hypothetical protein